MTETWTNFEIATLRDMWPRQPRAAILAAIPKHTRCAIRNKASEIKVRRLIVEQPITSDGRKALIARNYRKRKRETPHLIRKRSFTPRAIYMQAWRAKQNRAGDPSGAVSYALPASGGGGAGVDDEQQDAYRAKS